MAILLAILLYAASSLGTPLLQINQTTTLPTNNKTVLETESAQAWVSASPVRSTWEILYSCLVALITCFASFVQLNHPAADERSLSKLARKVKWMIITILIPEVVVLNAWQQWAEARNLVETLRRIHDARRVNVFDAAKSDHPAPAPDLQYCFLVVSGGLVVDTSELHNSIRRMTLTPQAVAQLAERGIDIPVSGVEIESVQHSDVLGQMIATWQLTWLILTVVGRQATQLPISLLELNTVVNIAFAICFRMFWWFNPSNLAHPILVKNESFRRELAVMLMSAQVNPNPGKTKATVSEFDYLSYSYIPVANEVSEDQTDAPKPEGAEEPSLSSHVQIETNPARLATPIEPNKAAQKENARLSFRSISIAPESCIRPPKGISCVKSVKAGEELPELGFTLSPYVFGPTGFIELSEKDLLRWKLADSFLHIYYGQSHSEWENLLVPSSWRTYLVDRARNFFISRETSDLPIFEFIGKYAWDAKPIFFFSMALLLHGSFHLTAWNWSFPTGTEKLLWKLSSFGLCLGFLPIAILGPLLGRALGYRRKAQGFMGAMSLFFIVLSSGCSVFLFLESFIALRKSPSGVYARLDWSKFLPSIG